MSLYPQKHNKKSPVPIMYYFYVLKNVFKVTNIF